MVDLCPCGSERPFDECCRPCIEGTCWPEDAEHLVRARYSAYVTGNYRFLIETTHPDFREDLTEEELAASTKDIHWLRLEMGDCAQDVPAGENGERYDTVDFYAYYVLDGVTRRVGEKSFFRRHEGKLYYVDGVARREESYRRPEPKIGRNEPCPCGSGKKYKKCCGR